MTRMPYNTRRKSLSLPSLGIALPNHSRAHRSNSKSSSPDAASLQQHQQQQQQQQQPPPSKRIKRSHEDDSPTADVSSSQPTSRRALEQTPPPSPGETTYRKVDTDGINDDIVVAVIEQLEKTGNRPHLIKDLATVLANSNDSIAHSANPAALLSSRLSLYLKRPWTALSPCPLAKELMDVHPRKVFFYLTTMPRQPLPESSDDIITPDIKRLTPSISDPSVEDEDMDRRERVRFSPSPEVELFSPELDDGSAPSTPGESFSGRNHPEIFVSRPSQRAPSPSLEADERGFTETATAVRKMKIAQNQQNYEVEQKQEYGYELFGSNQNLIVEQKPHFTSSPMIHAKSGTTKVHLDVDMMEMGLNSWSVLGPESIDVEDLDEMFIDF